MYKLNGVWLLSEKLPNMRQSAGKISKEGHSCFGDAIILILLVIVDVLNELQESLQYKPM